MGKIRREVGAQTPRATMRNIRIIPRLDIKGPNVIKGVHLECLRIVGDPESLATKYYREGADEIIYMDSVASLYGRNNLTEVVKKTSKHIFVPLTVGGGVRSLEDINKLLRAGADKVAINSWLIREPIFAEKAIKTFGSQCIVGSIEAKRMRNNKWEAFYNNGREFSGKDAIEWASELVQRGVGELLITSIDQEGTKRGYDCELVRNISALVSVPVIASGGAGSMQHIKDVIFEGKADAVALASMLHHNRLSISDINQSLKSLRPDKRESLQCR